MADLTSFLFQGAAPVTQPTGTDSSTNFPLWLQQEVFNASNAATNLAAQPYTPYPGQTVAGPSPTTSQSWDAAKANVGNYQPSLTAAGTLTQQAGTPVSSGDINQYLNPYESNVTDRLAVLAGQNLNENLLPGVNDTFTKAGQFGSTGNSEFTSRALRDTNNSLLNAQSGALERGYSGALSAAQAQKGQQLAAGAQTGQLGTLTQQLGAADVSQLAGAGASQDKLAQANINSSMNQFQQQQQFPYQNLGFLSNIIHGLPVGSTTQSASTTPVSTFSPSAVGTGVGVGALASGLGYRKGGAVKGRSGGALRHAGRRQGGALRRAA